jgi:Ca2+-binding RTX toxin-like protein
VFTKSGGGWAEQVLAPTGVSAEDAFGWSVAVDGDRIVVGAPGDDGKGADAGAAYVFERSGGVWSQTKKMLASDGVADDQFGRSVAVSGDRIAVGAPGQGLGDVYSYTGSGSTWRSLDEEARATNYPARLGWDVDVDGDRIIAGAPWKDVSPILDAGMVNLFEFQFCDGRAATLVGTDGDDPLVGTPENDVIVGRAGDDVIDGGGGHDFICAGPGDDEVDGGGGNDRIFGEDGNDLLNAGLGVDKVYGGNGADTIYGGGGDYLL